MNEKKTGTPLVKFLGSNQWLVIIASDTGSHFNKAVLVFEQVYKSEVLAMAALLSLVDSDFVQWPAAREFLGLEAEKHCQYCA